MNRRYDLVVIGAGPAGLVAAPAAARLGARVALVEKGRPGGDCTHYGCIPSKTLLASAALASRMRGAEPFGIEPVSPKIDFPGVMRRVRDAVEHAAARDLEYLGEVELIEDFGRFVGPDRISAGGRELRFRKALIATGSGPAVPPIPGLEGSGYLTNETVFELNQPPARLLVLGGGPIGVELGQALARLGSKVTIVEALPRLLPRDDAEASSLVERGLRAEGVEVLTGTRAAEVIAGDRDTARPADATDAGGPPASGSQPPPGVLRTEDGREIGYDRVLVATGRRTATEGLGLEAAGVETDERGAIQVDKHLRTTSRHIYAAGDVVGQLQFTHVAGFHGLTAMGTGLFRAPIDVGRYVVPWVTFCDPEVAQVGLTEAEARERLGRDPEVFRQDYEGSDRALTAGTSVGFAKLIADRRGRLLGATIVGESASESIAEVTRLIQGKGKVAELPKVIHAYPTFAEIPARAADEWFARRYFTPMTRRLMRPLLAVLRMIDRPRR